MKKIISFIALTFIFTNVYSQDDLDRTGLIGEVISQFTIVENELAGTEVETETETTIIFDSKFIAVNSERYDIVSKEFDGVDTNSFLCSKRGSNYTITYIVNEFIAIYDNINPEKVTYYEDLSEQ